MRTLLTIGLLALLPFIGLAQQADESAVKKVITQAYIEGIQNQGDIEAVRQGFHPDFEMLINRNGQLSKFPISAWIERLEQRKANPSASAQPPVSGKFLAVSITGNAAVVTLELHRENKLIFTDYISLYKFGSQWKIVSKIYHQH